jgi:hypothetical protein
MGRDGVSGLVVVRAICSIVDTTVGGVGVMTEATGDGSGENSGSATIAAGDRAPRGHDNGISKAMVWIMALEGGLG